MENFNPISFTFKCSENFESFNIPFILKDKNSYIFETLSSIKKQPLGTAFCSLLNSENDILSFKDNFKKNWKEYFISDTPTDVYKGINLIFQEFVSINKYFVFTQNNFTHCNKVIESINTRKTSDSQHYKYSGSLKTIAIFQIQFSLTSIYRDIIGIAETINSKDNNKINPPPVFLKSNTRGNEYPYRYNINNIKDLITSSYYQLLKNKYHIKQCEYPNCNKYFVTKLGQTRYCNNPCPADPTQTCNQIPKKISSDKDFEKWENDLSLLDKLLNKINTRYLDKLKNEKNKQKQETIINNKIILLNISKDLRKYIKGVNDDNKRNNYIKIYQDFLNDIENNLNLNPPIFKIKKIKY